MDGHCDPATFFTFTAGPRPATFLTFQLLNQDQGAWRRPKRHRALTDVDGERSSRRWKKKRRLRLYLITSRLSRPFSAPATHIVDRGSSRIAVWAKQRALGRHLLRKAAIMNHVRLRAEEAQRAKQRQMEMSRQAFVYDFRATSIFPERGPF